jgi:small subunit ribosomal protein S2e
MMAGIDDSHTIARGCTATLGNFAKDTFDATSKTYSYLTPDLWKETVHQVSFSGIHRPSVKTHTSLFRRPRLCCGYHTRVFIQEK